MSLALGAFFALSATSVAADGGAVVAQGADKGVRVTVFAEPIPLRVGPSDLSAMVQDASGAPMLDCEVTLVMTSPANSAEPLRASLKRDGATNKLLYHALVTVPEPGAWHGEVSARCAAGQATASATWDIGAPPSSISNHWPYLAFPGLVIAVFLWFQASRRGGSSARSRVGSQ